VRFGFYACCSDRSQLGPGSAGSMQPYWVSANAVTTHGLPVAFTWKDWVHTGDDDSVWWQLDPIFKSLDLCQGKELMADWLRKRLPAYDVDWEAANLTRELAYQPSRKSQEAKAKSAGTAVAGPPCQHSSHTLHPWLAGLPQKVHCVPEGRVQGQGCRCAHMFGCSSCCLPLALGVQGQHNIRMRSAVILTPRMGSAAT